MSTLPYRTLFICTLRQKSGLSVGGLETDSFRDKPLATDGTGNVVLNGKTIAGNLVATARAFLDVPEQISRFGDKGDDEADPQSLWRIDHAIPWNDNGPVHVTSLAELEAISAHRHDTRGTQSGALGEIESLPVGISWRFVLDVVHPFEPNQPDAAVIAAAALREWQRGRCWMGGRVARGLGWMVLDRCRVITLPRSEDAIDAWPSSRPDSLLDRMEAIGKLCRIQDSNAYDDLQSFLNARRGAIPKAAPRRAYVRWPIQVSAGEYLASNSNGEETSFGLDAVSIGGHDSEMFDVAAIPAGCWARTTDQEYGRFVAECAPDKGIVMTRRADNKNDYVPVVTASAISGAFRHRLARDDRACGQQVLDPATGERYPNSSATSQSEAKDRSTALFGSLDTHPSRLLIRDGFPDRADWTVALLEKLALDEFAQSAMDGAKFDRLAVLEGAWDLEFVLEVRLPPEIGEMEKTVLIRDATAPVRDLLNQSRMRRIGIGAGEFRAYGHVAIDSTAEEWALAGDDWQRPWDQSPSGASA